MSSDPLLHLLNFLEDEFRGYPEVRIRPIFRSGTRRSIDLEQDYDPNSNAIHENSGVTVQANHREYFFPAEWASIASRPLVEKQVQLIRDAIGLY